ncbi:MAG TPA: SGNH/GDSL hydrolase family protein [Gemmatimonadales bacterium]|nr:SGNH/GDSL hydrolase family protein [Gemmatimonadales bacterium]
MTDNRKGRLSRLATNVGMALGAVLVALLLCELVLRLMGVSYSVYVWTDPVVGVAHIPGVKSQRQSEGQPWIGINSDGLRGPETSLEPPPGTYRIALLGDSFIEAFEVPYQSTVGEVIERRLSALRGTPVEVLNFGVGGYGTSQELLTLQHKVWKYSPDLVLLAVTTGNDISDNYRPLKRSEYVPYHVYQGDSLVLDTTFLDAPGYRSRAVWTRRLLTVVQHSRVAQVVNRVRHVRRKSERQRKNAGDTPEDELGLRDEVHLPPSTPEWQEAWRVTEGVLRLMRDECRARSTPFALVTLTRGIQVTPERAKKEKFLRELGTEDLYYPERRLAEFGEREGIPVLNLAPTMAKQAEERQVYFHAYRNVPGIGHWNVEGHRAAGELISAWLARGPAARPGEAPTARAEHVR